jgi:endoglucanase
MSSAPAAGSLDAYPPTAPGAAPGASPAARAAARSLGRGVNFGNVLESAGDDSWGLRVEDELIQLVGPPNFVNHVRLPVRWSGHASADAGATIDPAFFRRVDGVVQRLLDRGVMVVLNMHHYRQLDGDGLDAGETAVDAGVVQLRFLAMWRQIARRYEKHGPRLLFEPYNEPHGRQETTWNDLLSRAVRVIRESNPERVLVVGPTRWNSASALKTLVVPNDPHLIVTVHHYDPFGFTHQGAEWVHPPRPTGVDCCSAADQALMAGALDLAAAERARLGYPVYVGEFGAYGKAPQAARLRYLRFMREGMEQRGLPWAYWELAAGFGLYDPQAHAFRADMKSALYGL